LQIEVWGADAPSPAVVGALPTTFLVEQEKHFGAAPKLTREARALTGKDCGER